mgnify:FL=1
MKFPRDRPHARLDGRSPSGERGLKYLEVDDDDQEPESLPIRGAWIEIRGGGNSEHEQARRSPSGERGLKCHAELHGCDRAPRRSPSGERGLKFIPTNQIKKPEKSLPIRGAWIEISCVALLLNHATSRSPSGERGLKLDGEGMANLLTGSRSPSGERGLKCENPDFGRADGESLPIRGAWIEIAS